MPRATVFESDDPADHRRELNKMIASFNGKARVNFRNFLGALIALFGDSPPLSWRFAIPTERSERRVAFQVHDMRTGRTNFFLLVFDWGMVINRKFVMSKYEALFRLKRGHHNRGDAVRIEDWGAFGAQARGRYKKAIVAMLSAPGVCIVDRRSGTGLSRRRS